MRSLTLRHPLLLVVTAALAVIAAGCGTLENEVHITYRTPTQTVTKMTLRGGGPMKDVLLSGDLRNLLSRAGWEIGSDDGGEGPALLTASYESSGTSPFPEGGPTRGGRSANPGQALFRMVESSIEETLFTRRLTVKFTNEPGMLGTPPLADAQGQQVLEALLAVVGLGPQGSNTRPQQDNPFSNLNLDRASFDQMLNAVLTQRVTITMPGRVALTNGAASGNNTVTWRLDAAALREAREYYVVSEETLWAKAGAAAGATLMFVAAFALLGAYLIGQRRRPAPVAATPARPASTDDDGYANQFRPHAAPDDSPHSSPDAPDDALENNSDDRPPTAR